jgi:hypothetical protein
MSNAKSDTWSELLRSDETAQQKEGPSAWDKVASTLAGVANVASGFVAEQVHAAGQDFVSRVLLGESYSPPEHGKEPEKDREPEPDKDQGMER